MNIKALLLGCALSLGALPGGAVFQDIACASPGPSAALVVDTGSGASSFCVTLPSSSVSGTKLIQLAGEQHGLQYRIEGGAVCQLAGTGPSEGDCFSEHPNFWGYWRGDGSGGWTWSSSGAATTTVEAGDVEGWAWGSGNDGSTHPSPPATRYSSVCNVAAPSEPKEEPASEGGEGNPENDRESRPADEGPENDDATATTEGTLENDDGDSPADNEKKQKRTKKLPVKSKSGEKKAVASSDAVAAPDTDDDDLAGTLPAGAEDEGPPMVGLVGLGAALLLGGLGALALRRRKMR